MKKTLDKKTVIIIVAAALAVIAGIVIFGFLKNNNKVTATTMRLMEMQGTVTLESGGKIKEVIDNLKLNSGDILSTASESYVSISLDDYKMVKIQEKSKAEFTQSGKELALNLIEGALFFDVSKKLDVDESFQISTSTMVVGIRGTSGYVFVENEGQDGILVTDGVVDITGINPETGETKTTKGYPGQYVRVYILDDDGHSVDFELFDATEASLPEEVVDFLVEHPELMERVCKATGWKEELIIDRSNGGNGLPKQEDTEETEETKETDEDQDESEEPENPEKPELPPEDPPVLPPEEPGDPPADPPEDPPVIENPEEEETPPEDDGDDDDDDDDDSILISEISMVMEASVDVGEVLSLAPDILPSNATNKSLIWSSSNTAVAKVDSSGVVKGIAEGTAIITAKARDGSGKSASCTLSVDDPVIYIDGLSYMGFICLPNVGDTSAVQYSLSPSNVTNQTVTWTSNAPGVAEVSSEGVVTAKGTGVATIEGVCQGSAPGNVNLINVKVYVGGSFGITLNPNTITPSNAHYRDGTPDTFTINATLTAPSDFNWYAYVTYELSTSTQFEYSEGSGEFDYDGHMSFTVTQTSELLMGQHSVTVTAKANGYTIATRDLYVNVDSV